MHALLKSLFELDLGAPKVARTGQMAFFGEIQAF